MTFPEISTDFDKRLAKSFDFYKKQAFDRTSIGIPGKQLTDNDHNTFRKILTRYSKDVQKLHLVASIIVGEETEEAEKLLDQASHYVNKFRLLHPDQY